MKLLIGLLFVLGTVGANAQFAVTTNSGSGLAATYTSLANAITALNAATITSPVVITCPTGTETAPAGGYSITAQGTSTNTIAINGNGAANSIITAGVGVSTTNDGIIKLIGADYITLQGFTLQESAGNTTSTTIAEWGVALLYASTTNGAQNNTIQNNTITLNRSFSNTFGIYSNVRHTATAATTTADITLATGSNFGNKIYSNAISNVDYGIVFVGSNAAAAMDNGNDIGGSSAATANTITNWGGLVSGAISTYVSVTGSNACIYMNHQINENVSFNTIASATNITTLTTSQILGILKAYSTSQPTGTITATYNSNTVTLTNAPTTSQMSGISLQGLTALSTATFNCNNNNIINCANTGASATSSAMLGIFMTSAPGTFNITGNTVRGFTSTSTSGGFTGIQQQTNGVVTALNINNNKIGDATAGAVTFSNATSGAVSGIIVTSTGAASTCALSITGNDFRGIVYSVAGSGAHTYISNAAVCLSQNISTNTFTNLNVNTTGSVTFISNSVTAPATGFKTINSNSIVTAFNKGGAGGTIAIYNDGGSSVCTTPVQNNNNNFSNITVTGATTISGWFNNDGTGSTPQKTITGNTFNNWTCGTSAVTVLQSNFGGTISVSNNTITNITGQSTITGFAQGSSGTITTFTLATNTITGLSSTGTGGAVTAISNASPATTTNINGNIINSLSSSSTTATVAGISTSASANIFSNKINTLSCVGSTSGVANGIMVTGGTAHNIYKNKIYDLLTSGAFSTAPGVNGIVLSGSTSAVTATVYNNIIGDLRATASTSTDAIRGLSVTATGTTSTYNIYYNTIYITGAGGTNFGSSGIFHAASATATTAALNLRNNIIVNATTPNGTGLAVAYRRSAGTAGTLANYVSTSNNNLFYAGTSGASNLIYSDGTSSATTIALYKAGVFTAGTIFPRDANSVSENPPFLSLVGASANFLHIDPTIATQVESGAATIATFTDDFDGDIRNGTTPDIGADEFTGTPAVPMSYVSSTAVQLTGSACAGTNDVAVLRMEVVTTGLTNPLTLTNITINGNGTSNLADVTTYRIYYTGNSSTFSTTTPIIPATAGLTAADIVVTPGATVTLSGGTNYFWLTYNMSASATGPDVDGEFTNIALSTGGGVPTVTAPAGVLTVNPKPIVGVSPGTGTICNPGGTGILLTANGASTYTWAPPGGLSATTGTSVTATPASTTTYTVTGTDGNGCTNTVTSIITVSAAITLNSVTATPSVICSGANSQLLASASVATTSAAGMAYSSGTGQAFETITTPTTVTTVTSGTADDGYITVTPTPTFNFKFAGTTYTSFGAGTNGYVVIGGNSTSIPSLITSLAGLNVIYGFGRDGNLNVTNSGSLTHGPAAGGKYVFQMNKYSGGASGAESATIYDTYQIVLWGSSSANPGRIDIIYGSNLGTPSTSGVIGIRDIAGTFINGINGSTTLTTTSATWPVSGQIYSFANPVPATFTWDADPTLSATNIANPIATAVTSTTIYNVTASQNGCSASGNVTVTISAGAAIGTQPVSTTKCAGQTATFTVVATGPSLTYQWRKGGIDIPIGGNASAGTATLSLPNVTAGDAATYDVVVTSTCGSPVTSDGASTLTVNPLPTSVPSSNSPICTGNTLNLTGGTDIGTTYAWTGPNSFTSASQNPSIAGVTSAAAGIYSYTATSAVGCPSATNTTTVLINQTPSAVSITPTSSIVCSSGPAQLLTASGGTIINSTTVSTGVISVAIPDNSSTGINNTLAVSGISGAASIDSVIVTFSITHGFDQDIIVNLEGPNGQIINLVKGTIITGGVNFTNTRISSDDTKPAIPATGAPFTATYRADKATSGFQLAPSPLPTTAIWSSLYGTPNGNWKIRVYDDESIGTGTFTGWSIKVAYSEPTTFTWTPNGAGNGLYTDAAATTIYNGGPTATVYALPSSNTTYTATATSAASCSSNNTVAITVNQPATANAGPTQTVCAGNTITLAGSFGGAATTATWSGGAGTFTPNATTMNAVYTPTAGEVTAGTVTLTLTTDDPAGPCGQATSNMTVTISSSTSLAPSGSCKNMNVGAGATYTDGSCNTISKVVPNGASPVTGMINSCVTIDGTVQYFNAAPYVQRHVDIEPLTNTATATARVTIYALQSEFDAYNAVAIGVPFLPVNPGDVAGIANLRVTQYHGTAAIPAPGNYSGAAVLINPDDAAIIWNPTNNWWEISFDVTGFSGFFIHTTSGIGPLPITINYFNGTKQGSNHLLNWKVTCNASPSVTMTLERSSDSRNFTGINSLTATAARCNQPFSYTDASPLPGMNYYRLKMVDVDGKVSYSGIVALLNAVKGFDIISIAPNPVTNGNFNLNVTSAQASKMELTILDMQGRLVNRQTVSVIAGSMSIPMNVNSLSSGTYTLYGIIGDDKSRTIRFVKQ